MRLLKYPQACERAAISRSTLFRLLRSGQIQSVKIGSAVRIPESALEDFIASLKEAADVR